MDATKTEEDGVWKEMRVISIELKVLGDEKTERRNFSKTRMRCGFRG